MISKILALLLLSNMVFLIEQNQDSTLSQSSEGQFDAFSTSGTLDASAQNLLQNAQVREERVQIKPRVITQRITAKPKIITERITGQPRIVTEQVIEPTRQRIVIQPKINRTVEQLQPQYNQLQDEMIVRDPVTRPVEYKTESRTQTVNVPGDVINNRYIVEPSVKRIRTNVQIQPSETIRRDLEPIVREAQVQNNPSTRNYTVPGDVYITQPYVQPIQQRERLELNWNQEQDRVIDREPITRNPIYQSRTRSQAVNVPGDVYYKQDVTRPTVNQERVQVQFQQGPTQETRNEPIVEPTKVSRTQAVQRNVVPYQVRDEIPVGVPEPVVYDVPVYHYEYVPVEEPCDPCCCGNNKGNGISQIINSTEVEIFRGGRKILPAEGSYRGDYQEGEVKPKEKNFEDALNHYSKLYGGETFSGNTGFAWGSPEDYDDYAYGYGKKSGNHAQLRNAVNTVYNNVKKRDDANNYMHEQYSNYRKKEHSHAMKGIYGEEHEEPVFIKEDKPWGHIPAMNGYKNYEHYMKY